MNAPQVGQVWELKILGGEKVTGTLTCCKGLCVAVKVGRKETVYQASCVTFVRLAK